MTTRSLNLMSSFRQKFILPDNNKIQWFPGHMQKGTSQMVTRLKNIDCLIEVHDARIPFTGRNPNFSNIIAFKPHILILNKVDLADMTRKDDIVRELHNSGVDKVFFTNCLKNKNKVITRELFPAVVEVIESKPRYNRQELHDYDIMVIGVPNVGKSTLINIIRRSHTSTKKNAVSIGSIAGITKSVGGRIRASFDPPVFLTDTPGILTPKIPDTESGMKLALCGCLPDHLVGEEYIVDYMLYWLNKNGLFSYVDKYDLKEPTEDMWTFLTHIAKNKNLVQRRKSLEEKRFVYMPNFQQAAIKVLKDFRSGELGQFLLDDV